MFCLSWRGLYFSHFPDYPYVVIWRKYIPSGMLELETVALDRACPVVPVNYLHEEKLGQIKVRQRHHLQGSVNTERPPSNVL